MEAAVRIGERLRRLREERGWTQIDLARKVDASQPSIAGIETGCQLPGTGLLGRLASLFRVDLDYFYRAKENPFEMLLRAEEVKPEIRDTLRDFTEKCMRFRDIEQVLGYEPASAPDYGYAPSVDVLAHGEQVAEAERRRLDIGSEPVHNLPSLLDRQGLRTMGIEADDDLDGVFLFSEEEGGFALVNTACGPERQLFTLAHEYGHFLMHRSLGYHLDYAGSMLPKKGDRLEMAANSFAAAFLMPRPAISAWWLTKGQSNLPEITGLRRHLCVSYRALGWRLVSLGLISKQTREKLEEQEALLKEQELLLYRDESPICLQISAFSDRQRFLAFQAYLTGKVTISKLADWLDTDVITADEIAKTLRGEASPSVPAAH